MSSVLAPGKKGKVRPLDLSAESLHPRLNPSYNSFFYNFISYEALKDR